MNKLTLVILALTAISVLAQTQTTTVAATNANTQDEINANACKCKNHPFLPIVKAYIESLGLSADADVVAALKNFNDDAAVNNIDIPETWKELAHLKGERSCCNDTYLVFLRVIAKAIFKNTDEKPPLAARILFALPRLCKVQTAEGVPATIQEFLLSYKPETGMNGADILKTLAQARIHLAINFAMKTRGFLGALCVSPCRANELIDGNAVLVNKKSDDELAKHFEEGKKKFEELQAAIKAAIKFFVEKFGGDECKAQLAKLQEKIDASVSEIKRTDKLGGKPPVQTSDEDAEAKGKDVGITKDDKSPRQKPDGKEKELPEDAKKKLEEKEAAIKAKLAEQKAAAEKAAADRPKVDVAAIKAQLEAAKLAGCTVEGCVKCTSNIAACDQCAEGAFLVLLSSTATESTKCALGGEARCKEGNGTWSFDSTTKVAKCVLSGDYPCTIKNPGCLVCKDKDTCETCKDGAFKDAQGMCVRKCVVDVVCTACDTAGQYCSTCATGLVLDANKKCIKPATCVVDQVCTKCDATNASKCGTCATGFTLHATEGKCLPTCVDGQKGCKTCNTQVKYECTTCADTHFLTDRKFCAPKQRRNLLAEMRRVLAETDTKTTETGGIQVNVASESDKTDASVDGVTTEGCINAADCQLATNTYKDATPVEAAQQTNDAAKSSAGILSFAVAILALLIIA